MLTTLEILSMVKKKYGNCSNYRAAQLLEVNKNAVSNWVTGRCKMGEVTARKAAQLLDLDKFYVIACIHAEQYEGHDLYSEWVKICESLEPKNKAA